MTFPNPDTTPGRVHNPRTTFTPAGQPARGRSRSSDGKGGRSSGRGSSRQSTSQPRASHVAKQSKSSPHSAHSTSQRQGTHTAQQHQPAPAITEYGGAHVQTPRSRLHQATGAIFRGHEPDAPGLPSHGSRSLGHHPKADGLTHHPSASVHSLIRRAAILGYDSTSNTAIVRLGDTPDSPLASVAVSGNVSAAEMAAAATAYLLVSSLSDFGDATISTVL